MIFKKKILNLKIPSFLITWFNKFIFFIGSLTLIFFILVCVYYYTSGFSKAYPPKDFILRVNDKIINKYIGFDIRNFTNYLKIAKYNLVSSIVPTKLDKVYLEINQESILGIELQRKLRSEQGGEISDKQKIFLPADISFEGQNYEIKIRTKGVRAIHWREKNSTSYKIDMIGDKRLWGMEEFSFQKPITRNYTYEYLFHKLLGHVDLLNIKYFFVNLYLNDQNLGVYAVEESFSKEVIERQKRRNGPIFSLKDELGEYFPNVTYELYSENYWINQNPKLIQNAFTILNNLKNNKSEVNDHFDIDKWAKYFAIMDLTGAYHGSLLKSVKLFYNPTTALFEPIGYDLHKGAGIYGNFLLIDFLKKETATNIEACSFICLHVDWYLKFLKHNNGEINNKFVEKYINYLFEYSSKDFVENFISKYKNELSDYNKAIYKDSSSTDKVRWSGAGFFVYDNDYLHNRAKFIRNRINSINLENIEISKLDNSIIFQDNKRTNFPVLANIFECEDKSEEKKIFISEDTLKNFKSSCKKIELFSFNGQNKIFELKENIKITPSKNIFNRNHFNNLNANIGVIKISNDYYEAINNLIINQDTIINSNEKFTVGKNISINIINNSTLYIEGGIDFVNDEKNLSKIFSEDGTGSLIFVNNNFNLKNIFFNNLSKPNLSSHILYGGVNFVNSNINLDNIILKNSKNEDGINIIDSKSYLKNIYFEDIQADAFDIDFGELKFSNLNCLNVKNDCLDISGAKVEGEIFTTKNVFDKGISVGEKSTVNIKKIKIIDSNVALAVKDGSDAYFNDVYLEKNNFDIILFNKKQEFSKPKLSVKNINILNENRILQSIDTQLLIDDKNFIGSFKDDYINSKIY